MSLDVTFHPIREDELQRFVADVILDPALAGARAAEAVADAAKRALLAQVYETLAPIGAAALEGREPMAAVSLGAAAVAGFLHPYWYARGAGVIHLVEEDEETFAGLLSPLGAVLGEAFMAAPDPDLGFMGEGFMGGGFIGLDRLDALEAALDGPGGELAEAVLGVDGRDALLHAISYASLHGCGLLEASDVVSPADDHFFSDRQNLRAPYLDNAEDYANARDGLRRH